MIKTNLALNTYWYNQYLYFLRDNAAFIGRSKEYHSTTGLGPIHTHFRVWVMLIVENLLLNY